ncbi:MAG TPA: hypothetical protein VGZ22_01935 [Isosphaeraceae bacterium]|jgi:hypothetical protein|nr:hypothetical protein [Isosphaeraceae bacterium]
MRYMIGWMLAGSILLANAAVARAQVGVAVNPYTGTSVTVGQPYYGAGYGGIGVSVSAQPLYPTTYAPAVVPGATFYSSGYRGYVAPAATYYNSGFYGAYGAPAAVPMYGYTSYSAPVFYRRSFLGGVRTWPRRFVGGW